MKKKSVAPDVASNPIYRDPEAMEAIRYLALKYPIDVVLDWYSTMFKLKEIQVDKE